MAFSGGKGGFADINITPLVDVMLVLLVIYMVMTPIMPKEESAASDSQDISLTNTSTKVEAKNRPKIIFNKNGSLTYLNKDKQETKVNSISEISKITSKLTEKEEINLEIDKDIVWDNVYKLVAEISKQKVKYYFISQPVK